MSKDYVTFECVHIVETRKTDPDEKFAFAYADIDGYTANEEEEGRVICRVWLLNEKTNEYLVDWHHNGYRMNTTVRELIEQAKKDLTSYVENRVEEVVKKAYDKYKLKWLLDNDKTMTELLDKLQKELNDRAKNVYDAFDRIETTDGFNNVIDIWPYIDTFRESEWKDETIMRELLSGEDYKIWYNNHE